MQCKCGFENAADARFCGNCRAALGAVPVNAVPDAASSSTVTPVSTAGRVPGRPPISKAGIAIVAAVVVVAAAGYWWLNRPPGPYKQDNSGLYRIRENGKSGYMDRSGRTVIRPQFDDALNFSEGLAWVRVGKKVGFIDTTGKIVVTPQFDEAQSFVYGRAGVKLCCGGWGEQHFGDKYGYIDTDGKYISSPDFLWVGQFSGSRSSDLAPVKFSTGLFGFVSRSGKILLPGSFEDASILGFTGGPAPVRSNGKWGYIDKSGKWVIDPQFDSAWNYAGGLAPVAVSGKWGFIDSNGKFAVNPQFDAAFSFDNGYAPVRTGDKWTLIDTKGVPADGAQFLEVGFITDNGLRAARVNEGWGFVQGAKFVIHPLFDSAESFLGGLARVSIGDQYVYVDKSGAYVGDPFKGRAIKPARMVQEVWEGDVTAPSWKTHEKFLLIREGAKIKGFYSSAITDPSALGGLSDVAGDLDQNDAVRLMSENGFLWKGRFLAPVVVAGTRPNGEEGKAPEFPFRLHFVRDATADDMPVPLQPTSPDWGTFLVKFKEAVGQHDQASLAVMIGRSFYLQNARIRSVDDVFRQLNWAQLSKALADGSTNDRKSPLGRQLRSISDNLPCNNCVYQVMITFGEDADGQWRWTGITYPGD